LRMGGCVASLAVFRYRSSNWWTQCTETYASFS
jgi:hypothetical protein